MGWLLRLLRWVAFEVYFHIAWGLLEFLGLVTPTPSERRGFLMPRRR